ncbi:hypothetical protein FFK22_017000 [Mycobacterium sp. KBS0706]|nr:hypothetical protein FFK22_017000 [Mycobacterium sp. KBS0706]
MVKRPHVWSACPLGTCAALQEGAQDSFDLMGLERLGHDGTVSVGGRDLVSRFRGHECEGDLPILKNVGNGIDLDSRSEFHVQQGGVQLFRLGSCQSSPQVS